jgi:hypothetical protein
VFPPEINNGGVILAKLVNFLVIVTNLAIHVVVGWVGYKSLKNYFFDD